jgi:CRP-like cAMP-binding protein
MSINTTAAGGPLRNQVLAALPSREWKRVRPNLEPMDLSLGETLCESDSQLTHAYFPTTSTISLMCMMSDGTSTEIAAVGNEGLVGITLFMGRAPTMNRVVVQTEGRAYRLRAEILKSEFSQGDAMQYLLLRYTQARLTLIGQTAACNRRHAIDQQLCRWLLLSLDRVGCDELSMTHELLANTLGVRREGITEAALKLQAAGLIKYSRGRITVVDRRGVEASCCECYGVVRRALARLTVPPAQGAAIASVVVTRNPVADGADVRSPPDRCFQAAPR